MITDLGLMSPSGINNSGLVVGKTLPGFDDAKAVAYFAGETTELGSLGGPRSDARAVNASGQIVGASQVLPEVSSPSRAYLLTDGVMQNLGTISGFERYSYGANGINASGVVVGTLAVGISFKAFEYKDGVMKTLGGLSLSETSSALGINASGQIVGSSEVVDPNSVVPHAFLYTDGAMQDLGVAGSANAINDSGVIVGGMYVQNKTLLHAFVRIDGVIHDLGTLPAGPNGAKSSADAINSSGQIVGYSQTLANGAVSNHAFVYSDGTMLDLNNLLEDAPGWTLISASGINDAGQIIGLGTYNGVTHGYLLTPVPEPQGFVLAGLGLLSLFALRRRFADER